jgi:hypothetical protein
MASADVRGPRRPLAVAVDETAKPGLPGRRENVVDLAAMIGEPVA